MTFATSYKPRLEYLRQRIQMKRLNKITKTKSNQIKSHRRSVIYYYCLIERTVEGQQLEYMTQIMKDVGCNECM